MADPDLLNIIRNSIELWNEYRLGPERVPDELRNLNFAHPDLQEADFSSYSLAGANLMGANLRRAHLHDADMRTTELSNADLFEADMSGANLEFADLSGANLMGASLIDASLMNANLSDAQLREADLTAANLYYASLKGTDLTNAVLINVHGLTEDQLRTTSQFDVHSFFGSDPRTSSENSNADTVTHESETNDFLLTESGDYLVTQNDDPIVLEDGNERATPDGNVRITRDGNTRVVSATGTAASASKVDGSAAHLLKPIFSSYQTLLTTTPLDVPGLENPTLVSIAINLGNKHNQFSESWPNRLLSDPPDGWDVDRGGSLDDILSFLTGQSAGARQPILKTAILAAMDEQDAIVYFGSIGSLLSNVLETTGKDKIVATVKLGEAIVPILGVRHLKSVILTAFVYGTAVGVFEMQSTVIPRAAHQVLDLFFGQSDSGQHEQEAKKPTSSPDTGSSPTPSETYDDPAGVDV
ncbi:MAG: pentapeptide repeat-containing protein [Planctomycetota bacterium]